MKVAFPEMSRVTFVFSFNLINQKLQIADRSNRGHNRLTVFKFRHEDSDVFRPYGTGIGGIIILLKLQVTRPQRQTGLVNDSLDTACYKRHKVHLICRCYEYPQCCKLKELANREPRKSP